MFRALCDHHQEVKIVLYSIWYHRTCKWPSGAQVERGLYTGRPPTGVMIPDDDAAWPVRSQPLHRTATYRCDDTRCCIIQF